MTRVKEMTKEVSVCFCISAFLVLTFIIFALLKAKTGQSVTMYPPKMNCDTLQTLFSQETADGTVINQQ